MAMFFDPYGSGGTSAFGGSTSPSLYGGLLDDTQQEALRQRGLMGFLGGMQKAGSLDYVDPFSGVRIGGLAAGLAGGAQGMLNAQDQGVINALNAQKLGLEGQQLQFKVGGVKALMPALQKLIDQMGGAPAGSPDTSGPQTAGPGGVEPSGGIGTGDDPRGLAPYIQATAFKYGVDPDTALAVARSEGLANPVGDGGKSGGAFQLFTGGGMGNDFQKDTGLDPLDPKNERATIDYALKRASQEGWGAWNGAKKIGVTGFMGIDRNAPSTQFAGTGSDQSASGLSAPSAGDMGLPGRSVDLTLRSAPTSSPGIAQGDNGQPFRPASAQQGPDLAEGDSIGVGFTKYGGLSGNPVGGRNPQAVLGNIAANVQSNPDYYRGKTVLLSSGTMNDPDGSMTAAIPQQIAAIKAAGGNVVLAGADTGKFAPRNAQLAQIAQATGVPFAGALPTDNVHPGPDGYKSYVGTNAALALRIAQNGAPAAPIQLAQNGPATALAPAMPQAQPPMARGLPQTASGIDPRALALAGTGAMAGLYGLGDVVKPLENAFYNSPGYIGQKSTAEALAQAQIKQRFAEQLAALEAKGKLPYTPQRPGAALPEVDASGNPTGRYLTAPVPGQRVNPDTGAQSEVYTQMTPHGPIVTQVPGVTKLGPGQTAQLETGGHNTAMLSPTNPMAQPGAGTTSGAGAPAGGAPAAETMPTVSPYGVLPPKSEDKLPQSAEEAMKAIPTWQERVTDWTKGIEPARQAEQRLMTIAEAFKATQSGAFAEHKGEISAALKSVGINLPESAFGNPAALQMALHENILTTLPLLKAATPRPSQVEFLTTSENREHPNIQPEANLQMLAEDIALMRQAQNLPAAFNASGARNPLAFESGYYQHNPLGPLVSRVKQEIGPLKGMESAVPEGARHIGTYQGKPVYQLPDGTRKVLQ